MSVRTAACAAVLPFDGSFNYPRDTKSLASCTTTSSVLCKTLKELFLSCSSGLFLKADAKVRLFSELPKLFEENFQFLAKKIFWIDVYQLRTTTYLIIYIAREQ